MPKVSVIIPCYNQGQYIGEAVDSVLASSFTDYEIIIINDGSTDNSAQYIDELRHEKIIKSYQVNTGVCMARNNAIAKAHGEYILPLDADDKISPTYIEQAVDILDSHPALGIIYCEAEFIGTQSGKWELPDFCPKNILLENSIFSSAFFRKSDWVLVGGYDTAMNAGLEDWEFWLSILATGRSAYKIPQTHFYYRQHGPSRNKIINETTQLELRKKLFLKHTKLFAAAGVHKYRYLLLIQPKGALIKKACKFLINFIPIRNLRKKLRQIYRLS